MPLLALATPKPIMLNKRAIICLKVGTTATAKWTNSAGKSCSFSGVVGSNYGSNLAGSGEWVFQFSLSLQKKFRLTAPTVTLATVDVEVDALALPLAMSIPRIASRMICALTLTVPAEVLGTFSLIGHGHQLNSHSSSDPNCGAAYSSAIDDTIGGLPAGCSQNNPSNSASKPSKSPTCM